MMTVRQFNRRWGWLCWALAKLSPDILDSAYHDARDRQHREEDGWFRNKEGRWQQCRVSSTEWDDPIMRQSGCTDEFRGDFLKQDIADGCPRCLGQVMDNASEPDVMQRWGFR